MSITPRHVNRWSWFTLAIVLLLLGTASWQTLRQNFDEDLKRLHESSRRELRTIATFVSSELQAARYEDIERLLRSWGETNSSIAHLQLIAANGFVLATYQRAGEVQHALMLEQPISYSYRGEATLRLRLDLADIYRHQQRLVTELTIILVVFAVLLSLLLFVALQRQREAARLRQRTQQLNDTSHALAESEERLKLALDVTNDGLWDWDVQTNTQHLSPRWKAILGYAADELAETFETWEQRLHPDDRSRVLADLQAHFDDPARAFEPEYRMRNKTGDWIWIQSRGKVVARDADGRPRRMIGTITDVSARIKAEQERLRAQAFLDSAIENLPTMLFVKDAQELRFVRFNKAAEELLGYSRDEMLGKNDYDFFPKQEADFFTSKDKEVLRQKVMHDIPEEPIQTKYKGVRTLHTKKIPILDEAGKPLYLLGISEDITERRRAEMALQDVAQRFRQALRAARAGAWEWNMATNEATWSEENFLVMGLDPLTHQASFDNWLSRVHPEDRERCTREIQQALDAGRDLNLEFRVVWPSGEVRWINDVGRLVYNEEGKPVSMNGIQIDITDRKLTEELREAGARQLHAIVIASPVPKALNDEQGNITFLNPAFIATFGYTPEDIPTLAEWWPKAYPDPAYRQWVADTWQSTLAKCQREGTASPAMELNVRCKDGSTKTVLASAAPIGKTFAGNHLVTLYDITERKRAEASLRERDQVLRLFVEHSPAAIAMLDDEMHYLVVSRRWMTDYHLGDRDIIGRSHYEVFPEISQRWKDIHQRCLAGATERSDEDPFERSDGTSDWVKWEICPWYRADGSVGGILIFSELVTARKQAEAEREKLLAELTARNIEMENFVYTISHDLKSPLITIGGFVSLLEKDLAKHDGAAAADSLAEIKKATDSMQLLIENLLQLARLGHVAGEPREVDINALLQELQARCARHFEQEHATMRIAPNIARVRVDPVRLGEVLQNLVENALKYHRPGVPPVIEIGWCHEEGWFRLYVRDNGIGIKQEYQERIFGLFQRLDTHSEGTGVGLTISRRIIESFGGRLRVESEPGWGSTFWIELPESAMVQNGERVSAREGNLQKNE